MTLDGTESPWFFMKMQGFTPLLLSWTSCAAGKGKFWNIHRSHPTWVHAITISSPKLKNHCDGPGTTQEMKQETNWVTDVEFYKHDQLFLLSSDIMSEGIIAIVKKLDFNFLWFFILPSLPQSKMCFRKMFVCVSYSRRSKSLNQSTNLVQIRYLESSCKYLEQFFF